MTVRRDKVRQLMKNEFGFSFRKTKKVPSQGNSQRCLILRQQYALKLLDQIEKGKRIINFDETWLNECSFVRRAWAPKDESPSMTLRAVSPRLSVLGALDTDGNCWYSLTHSITDSNIVMLFFYQLVRHLDIESPGWQDTTVFLIDNAAYHTGTEMKDFFKKMEMTVMYTAPYSYSSSPIELLWASLKLGELNPDGRSTGKR